MAHQIVNIFCIAILTINCVSCKEGRSEAEKLVLEWQGKKINLIEGLECRIMGKDTIATDLLYKECKILVYVDSSGCFACNTKLEDWKELIKELKPISNKVCIVFFFQTSDYESVDLLFLQHGVHYPIFLDKKGETRRVNHFPDNNSVNVFLLNENNEVEIIGSPINNQRMWKLYREQINMLTGIKDEDWPEIARMGWTQ